MDKQILKKVGKVSLFVLFSLLIAFGSFFAGQAIGPKQFSIADKYVVTIGMEGVAYAATPDYVCDGTLDDVEFQQALNALPPTGIPAVTGGELYILAGNYVFANTVTRAINNVTINGVGRSASITTTGVLAPFTCTGQTGWTFRNFAADEAPAYTKTNGVSASTVVDGIWINSVFTIDKPSPENNVRGVTLVVAASDATSSEKAQADYVCDGTADDVEINAALTALVNGGTVKLSTGTFHIQANDSLDSFTNDTTLCGQGYSTQLIKDSLGANLDIVSLGSISNIAIEDLRLDSNNSATECFVIDADNVTGLAMRRLFVYGGANKEARITIDRCIGNIEMTNCDVSYARGTFVNSQLGASTDDTLFTADHTLVQGNRFTNMNLSEFAIGFNSSGARIIGNFIDTSGEGIDICLSKQTLVEGNIVKNCPIVGIYGEGGRDQIFNGNTVTGCDYGIGMQNLHSLALSYIGKGVISNNTITSCTDDGIRVYGIGRVRIEGNTLADIGDSPIWIGEFGLIRAPNCQVIDNNIYNFGTVTAGGVAIRLHAADGAFVRGNIIDGNSVAGNYGIRDDAVSDDCVVESNIVMNVANDPINMVGSGAITRFNIPSTYDNWPGGGSGSTASIYPDLLIDGGFEATNAASQWMGWYPESGAGDTFTWENSTSSHGGVAAKAYATITDTDTAFTYRKSSAIRCNYGDVFAGSMWVKCTNTGIKSTLRLMLSWKDVNGGFLLDNTWDAGKVDTNWHQLIGSATAPAGAAFVYFTIQCAGAALPTAFEWYIDDCTFVRDEGAGTIDFGTDTINSGSTSVVVSHDLNVTPTVATIIFTENATNPIGNWWVSAIGTDNFTVNVANDPGASNLDFMWEVRIR